MKNDMNQISVVKLCKELGCCDVCCVRYLGLKNPNAYENVHQFVQEILAKDSSGDLQNVVKDEHQVKEELIEPSESSEIVPVGVSTGLSVIGQSSVDTSCLPEDGNNSAVNSSEDVEVPPAKRMKMDNVCVSCLGVLQENTWPEAFTMVEDLLEKKRYECSALAVALSAPGAAALRERAVALRLQEPCPGYDHKAVMPLKEAWKWVFARRLASRLGKRLESGAVAPLLVTLSLEYPDDAQELELARTLAPELFAARGAQPRRFPAPVTRRAVEQALEAAGGALAALPGWTAGPPRPAAPARAVAAQATHAPRYLAGRYVKLSRALPQTPWLVDGRRMMHSSVQEIIFEPVAAAYGLTAEEGEQRLKLISAGREDVDVRCLGTGRPFALEVADPRRAPDAAELRRVCERISAERKVLVESLVPIAREELALLKQGEQVKCKTYEALCVKLGGAVTARDIANINEYRNTPPGDGARVRLAQRTPLRVLHRRPLLARRRALLALEARAVPARPTLFVLRLRAEAGTYVKEWAHGELRRTRPSLSDALGARADILALDVADVELPWPPARPTHPAPH